MKRNNSLLPAFLDSRSSFVTSFDRLFDEMLNESFPSFGKEVGVDFFSKTAFPKVDVIDTPTEVEIQAEIPGLTKEDVEITVEKGNVLSIKGEKKSKISQKDGDTERKYLYKELKHSSFCRKFSLGENLDGKNVSATFNNGILEIKIPKITEQKGDTYKVTIG